MRDDGRVLTRLRNAKPGFVPIAGSYVTVGCEDAEPAVARILSVNAEGTIEVKCSRAAPRNTATSSLLPTEAVRRLDRKQAMKGSMRQRSPGYWQLRVFEGADPLTG